METKCKRRKLSVFRRARSTASWKNLPWQRKPSGAVFFAAANLVFIFFALFFLAYSLASAQTDSSVDPAAHRAETQIYATADETSLPVGVLLPGENGKPIAESWGAGGVKWYLVKSKSGVIGWIKHDDGEQTKKMDNFFRNLPAEPNRISVDISIGSASAAPRRAVIVPINFSGRSAVVPVTFNHSVTANLVLDTGASMTLITGRVAANLRLPFTGSNYVAGIGGHSARERISCRLGQGWRRRGQQHADLDTRPV
jgi:hypothetical protein